MSGTAGYENDIDKSITHLFHRLLKEIHVAYKESLTSELVYIFMGIKKNQLPKVCFIKGYWT